MKLNAISTTIVYYLPIALLLAAWETMSQLGYINRDLVPPFSAVLREFWGLSKTGDLPFHAGISLYRDMAGLLSAIVVGVPLGIAMAQSDVLSAILNPLVSASYPLPKSALIPMLLIWFGIGDMSKIAAIFLGCLLPVVVTSYNGARGVPHQLVWSARSLGTKRIPLVWKIVFMSALPDILSGIRTALALSFVLLISAELLMSSAGLGYLIGILGQSGNYAGMFASVLTVTLIGFLADRGFCQFIDWCFQWRQ